MADTKISALTAVAAAAGANEFAVNESGASKKVSLTQLQAFLGQQKVKQLGSDLTLTTTLTKATNLDLPLEVGTWLFEYVVVYRSNTATVGANFGVNFSGTQTTFVVAGTQFEATTAASTGAADQLHATFGLRSGGAGRAPSTTAAIVGSISVDTVNADMMVKLEGLVVITVAGDLQLYAAKEAAGTGVQALKAATSLLAHKLA